MTAARLLSICALSALLACGGGGGGGSSAPPTSSIPGPTNLTQTAFTASEGTRLDWTPPSGGADGYTLEYRFGSGGYTILDAGYPLDYRLWSMDPSTPDLAPVTFRVKAIKGGQSTAYSNEATWPGALHPPSAFNCYQVQGGVQVNWQDSNHTVFSSLIIERRITAPDGSVGSWTALPVSGSFGTYVDSVPQEGDRCEYRAYDQYGSTRSRYLLPGAVDLPLKPPTNLQGTSLEEGTLLSWQNQSTRQAGVRIYRTLTGIYTPIADLPPGATSFQDQPLEAAPYTYEVAPATSLKDYPSAPLVATALPMAAPLSLSATSQPTGINLTWSIAPGSHPNSILVQRYPGPSGTGSEVVATLPGTATSYLDPSPSPDFYHYAIGSEGSFSPTYSDPAYAAMGPALDSTWLRPKSSFMPGGDVYLRGASGAWWVGAGQLDYYYDHGTLYFPASGTWTPHIVPPGTYGALWVRNPMLLDSAEHPGVFIRTYSPQNGLNVNTGVRLEQWDGSAWTEEVLASSQPIDDAVVAGDAANPVVAWTRSLDPSSGAGWDQAEIATRAAGQWTTTLSPLGPAAPYQSQHIKQFLSGPDGALYLLAEDPTGYRYFRKLQGGSWVELPAPPGASDIGTGLGLSMVAFTGGFGITYGVWNPMSNSVTWSWAQFTDTWSSTTTVLTVPNASNGISQAAASASDGRIALFLGTPTGWRLELRATDGTWKEAPLLSDPSSLLFGAPRFNGSGHLEFLFRTGLGSADPVEWGGSQLCVAYEEELLP